MSKVKQREMMMQLLEELAARCEAATGADRELDRAISLAIGEFHAEGWEHRIREFTGSLDAAMALVGPFPWSHNVTMATAYGSASVMPNDSKSTGIHDKRGGHCHGAATPALALAAASLRALHALAMSKDPAA